MKRLLPVLLILLVLAGCGLPLPGVTPSFSVMQQQQLQTVTEVQLNTRNYRIIKTNVVGSDWGVNFLGLIPIVSPNYVNAIKQLYSSGEVRVGSTRAIVNVSHQHTAPFFILFSIPRVTISADVVEFTTSPPVPSVPTP